MSEAKHTPGPWEWSEDSPDAVLRGGDRDVVLRPNYGTCAGDIYGIIMAKKEDKDLIAAAPELLEALEYLLGQCEENERNDMNFMGISMFAKEQATKAIQKASGQG